MITADTITDEMIKQLRDAVMTDWRKLDRNIRLTIELCDSAINDSLDHGGRYARVRCAEILNERAARKEHP